MKVSIILLHTEMGAHEPIRMQVELVHKLCGLIVAATGDTGGVRMRYLALYFVTGFLIHSIQALAVINGKGVTKSTPTERDQREALSSVVKIEMKSRDGRSATCSGTVIEKNPPLVLTAEHCTKDKEIVKLTYLDADLNEIVVTPAVKKVHQMGRKNDEDARRDLAVIEFERGNIPQKAGEALWPYGNACPVVVVPQFKDSKMIPGNDRLLVAGYGANVVHTTGSGKTLKLDPENPPSGTGTLRFGANDAVQVKDGLLIWNGTSKNGSDPLGRNVSVGPGDSGGPTFAKIGKRYVVAGINSFLDRFKEARTPNGQINAIADVCDRDINMFIQATKEDAKQRVLGYRPGNDDNQYTRDNKPGSRSDDVHL